MRWSGLTGNYLRVVTETDESVDLSNRVTGASLVGEIPGAIVGLAETDDAFPRGPTEALSARAG